MLAQLVQQGWVMKSGFRRGWEADQVSRPSVVSHGPPPATRDWMSALRTPRRSARPGCGLNQAGRHRSADQGARGWPKPSGQCCAQGAASSAWIPAPRWPAAPAFKTTLFNTFCYGSHPALKAAAGSLPKAVGELVEVGGDHPPGQRAPVLVLPPGKVWWATNFWVRWRWSTIRSGRCHGSRVGAQGIPSMLQPPGSPCRRGVSVVMA